MSVDPVERGASVRLATVVEVGPSHYPASTFVLSSSEIAPEPTLLEVQITNFGSVAALVWPSWG
jgi:hypothetical protein